MFMFVFVTAHDQFVPFGGLLIRYPVWSSIFSLKRADLFTCFAG